MDTPLGILVRTGRIAPSVGARERQTAPSIAAGPAVAGTPARFVAVAALALAAWAPLSGHALEGDRYTLKASESFYTDSNLFRIPDSIDPRSFGASSRGDQFSTTSVGAKIELPYSRQRFLFDLNVSDTRFKTYTNFDNVGRDLTGSWFWSAGNDLTGEARLYEQRTLANLAFIQSNIANITTLHDEFVSAYYSLDARTRLETSVQFEQFSNDAFVRKFNDYHRDTETLGVRYTVPSGNFYGAQLRVDNTSFPYRQFIQNQLTDNAFRDSALQAFFDWRLTGVSKVSGQVGVTQRSYSDLSSRNFTGITGNVAYDWMLTPSVDLTASLERAVGAILDVRSQFVLSNILKLGATWTSTPKISVQGNLQYSQNKFDGDPISQQLAGLQREEFTDSHLALGLRYELARFASLGGGMQLERRSANVSNVDYSDRLFYLNLQLAF